ncbi:hypothetical protein JCM10213_005921 [Rhodosporidiobolus nylandii]
MAVAAASLMPLVAQAFCDGPSSPYTAAVANGSPRTHYARDSPRRAGAAGQRTPQKKQPTPSPKWRTPAKSPRGADGRSPEDVHSWSDATLAERYQFIEEIGYGNWGSVWKVKPKLEGPDAAHRAVKLVHRSKNPTSSARVRALWTEFKCIRALRTFPHPNLISFREFIITPSYAIVSMAYHPRLMPVALPESKAKVYFRQLLEAVEHLHAHGISHNDIKPSNILLSADDRPVLCDFGFSQAYTSTQLNRFLSSLSWGTPEYLSPERAKGTLHDERLSDVWALGVTMYEIVVGRTPFEQTEDENFLNREQLEVYYNRTLSGRFFGDFIISAEFGALIHLMVEPTPHLRIQSCASALRHPFFRPPSPHSNRPFASGADYTPTRTALGKPASLVQTPSSTSKKAGGTPRKTPKTDERKKAAAFTIFQDEEAPSPARTGDAVSPFSPRRDPLANRSNQPAPPPPATPTSKAAPSTPKPFTIKKTPPPSRIPVRKGDIGSPVALVKSPRSGTVLGGGHRRLISSPTIPLSAVSQPLVEQPPPVPPVPSAAEVARLTRSGSLQSVRRKPVPAFDADAFVKALPQTQLTMDGETDEDEEVLKSREASPVFRDEGKGSSSESAPTTPDETPTFTSRTYTLKIGPAKKSKAATGELPAAFSNLGEVFTSDLPRLSRKSSTALASGFRKLSVKNIRRAPSAMSFAGLKNSFGGSGHRRRASLADSMYSMVEAEKIDERNNHTMPLDLASSPSPDAQIHRARLESFSRHIQHIMDARKAVDPFGISQPPPPLPSPAPNKATFKPPSPKKTPPMKPVREASREPSPEPFCFNSTGQLSPEHSTFVASPPPRMSSLRIRGLSPGRKFSSPVTSPTSPSSPPSSFRRGHRRIPTAIRNVPSVVLHESADDGDYSESDYSRADTPFERVASPPPPPRVMEPPRQLPTWVAADDSSEGSDGDVDEPTLKISSPSKLHRKPSHCSSIGQNVTLKASPVKPAALSHSVRTLPVTLSEQRVARPTFVRSQTAPPPTKSTPSGTLNSNNSTRPPSPALASLPFTNFDVRAASRASMYSSSTSSPQKKLGHKRSRSVLSFFFRSSSRAGGGETGTEASETDRSRSVSRMSNTSSLGWSTASESPLPKRVEGREKERKKGGRLRKVASKLFGGA